MVASNLKADNIRLKAASEDGTRGNVTVVGSNLTATDTIALAATGNVTVKRGEGHREQRHQGGPNIKT